MNATHLRLQITQKRSIIRTPMVTEFDDFLKKPLKTLKLLQIKNEPGFQPQKCMDIF